MMAKHGQMVTESEPSTVLCLGFNGGKSHTNRRSGRLSSARFTAPITDCNLSSVYLCNVCSFISLMLTTYGSSRVPSILVAKYSPTSVYNYWLKALSEIESLNSQTNSCLAAESNHYPQYLGTGHQ